MFLDNCVLDNVKHMFQARGYSCVGGGGATTNTNGKRYLNDVEARAWRLDAKCERSSCLVVAALLVVDDLGRAKLPSAKLHAFVDAVRNDYGATAIASSIRVVCIVCPLAEKGADLVQGAACSPDEYAPPCAVRGLLPTPKDGERHVEVWRVQEFYVCWPRHHLVPKHERISREQADRDLAPHFGSNYYTCLPTLPLRDMSCRYLALRRGDVVRISRFDHITGAHFYYRRVISA